MIEKPRLKTYLTLFPISETTWGLRGGTEELWRIKLSDPRGIRALSGLLPYLNGQMKVDDIFEEIGKQGVEPEVARALLDQLEASSFIEEASGSLLDAEETGRYEDQLAFFSRFTAAGGAKFQARLRDSKVAIVGSGAFSWSVCRHLAASGIGELTWLVGDPGAVQGVLEDQIPAVHRQQTRLDTAAFDRKSVWPDAAGDLPDLVVYPQGAHDPQVADALDAFSKKNGIPWLLLRAIDAQEGWVGPLFVPDDTASYLSLEARLRGNVPFLEEYLSFDKYLRENRRGGAPTGGLHAFFELLSAVASVEVVKFLSRFTVPSLAGRFLTINLMTWETEIHEVLRLPHVEADTTSQPRVYPWKDIPYDEQPESRRG
jgi:hypothetical protein